jgi:L-threonylcarbamoyladenylate synthase
MTTRLPHSDAAIAAAADVIRRGGLVAFPTETVYGLGADALSAEAAARIFEAKQRALNDPLIVHVIALTGPAGVEAVADLARLDADARALTARLIEHFWPGPLTLVLPRQPYVPSLVSAGLDSVAVRMPDHPVARALIAASATPIAAPSANLFGHVSPTTAQHVLDDLDGRIDILIDGGSTTIGVESTVLSMIDPAGPMILRPGGVTRAQIEAAGVALAQPSAFSTDATAAQAAPGMLASHYAPRARLELVSDQSTARARLAALRANGERAGALLRTDELEHSPRFVLGDSLETIAQRLYAGLRALDDAGVDVIVCAHIEGPRGSLAEAINDRLSRAAAKRDAT